MNNLRRAIHGLTAVSATAALISCSTMPPENENLANAKNAVDLASNSALVGKHAPLILDNAQTTLKRAESTWAREGESEIEAVNHMAYLAERYAQTALEQAATGEIKSKIDNASSERNQLLLTAREREIERLRQEAEANKRDAEQLRGLVEELEGKQTERGLILTLGEILFDLNKTELKAGGVQAIRRLAEFLKENPQRKILIEGHTDSLGDEGYNLTLSKERASAVERKLLEFGVASSNIDTTGYGEQYPVATNDNAAGRQQNRRVEVVIANEGDTPKFRSSAL